MPTVHTTRQVELRFSHHVPDGLTDDETDAFVEVAERVALRDTFPRRRVEFGADTPFSEIARRHGITEARLMTVVNAPSQMSTVAGTVEPGDAGAQAAEVR